MSGDATSSSASPLLGQLSQLLQRQIELAGREAYEAAADLTGQVDELLARIDSLGAEALVPCAEKLKRIRSLRDRLNLTVLAGKQEYRRERDRMRKGRRVLRVYGQ
ncbi:MAG: hypothetical protein J7M14_03660 [Planctomycetes bacterium]|nr:hypothetical protein [Planctomycetota bacterium]